MKKDEIEDLYLSNIQIGQDLLLGCPLNEWGMSHIKNLFEALVLNAYHRTVAYSGLEYPEFSICINGDEISLNFKAGNPFR